jgi:cell division protein FtsB
MPEDRRRPAGGRDRAAERTRAVDPEVDRQRRRRRIRRGLWVVAVPTVLAFLVVFVYPTRTWLQQRRQLDATEQQLTVLQRDTALLRHQNERLGSDAEVERRAREDYGMARPGETAYVLVPAQPLP